MDKGIARALLQHARRRSFRKALLSRRRGRPAIQRLFFQQPPSAVHFSTSKKVEEDGAHPVETPSAVDGPRITDEDFRTSDLPVWTWVERYLPLSWQPYARLGRLDKPIGTGLLLWPCWWSTALAAPTGQLPDLGLFALFTSGALFMRSAGCAINDLWDQDLDQKVRRTSKRPLAAGELTRTQAYQFTLANMTGALGVVYLLPNQLYCLIWSAASLPFVAAYPSMKRFFPYPQLFLGMTINWGAWVGWAAVHGSMDYGVIAPLYTSGITWTLVYDTLYAHQDKHDDSKLGLRSTAITFGDNQRPLLHGLAALTGMQWLYVCQDLHVTASIGALAAYSHLAWQVQTADFEDPHNLMYRFRSNNTTAALFLTGLVTGNYLA